MAVKASDLARAWGLSRARLSQMKKEGMPLSSLAEAEAWRTAHHGTRVIPGRHGGHGKRNIRNEGGAESGGGSLGFGDGGGSVDGDGGGRAVASAVATIEDCAKVLDRLAKNEEVAYGMMARAINAGNDNEVLTRERHYKEAAGMRLAMSDKALGLLQRMEAMVTLDEARELFGRHLHALRLMIRSMPTRLAARCNPSDPALARQALNEAVERLFKSMNEWDL